MRHKIGNKDKKRYSDLGFEKDTKRRLDTMRKCTGIAT